MYRSRTNFNAAAMAMPRETPHRPFDPGGRPVRQRTHLFRSASDIPPETRSKIYNKYTVEHTVLSIDSIHSTLSHRERPQSVDSQ